MVLAGAAAIALSGCSAESQATVTLGEVTTETVVEVVEAPANVVAAATAGVDSPATGTVQSLRVRDGQQVRRGDVLLVVDSPQTKQALAQAQQAAASAPAPLELPAASSSASVGSANQAAEQAFERAREAARQIPDRATRQQALQQIAAAQAQVVAAQAQATATVSQINQGIAALEQSLAGLTAAQGAQADAAVAVAQRAVDDLVVKAPIAGRVVFGPSAASGAGPSDLSSLADQLPDSLAGQAESVLGGGSSDNGGSSTGALETGSPVTSGDPLLTITDVSTLSLRAEVDETDVLLVRKGVTADVELDAVPGAVYRAVVRNVDLSPTGWRCRRRVRRTARPRRRHPGRRDTCPTAAAGHVCGGAVAGQRREAGRGCPGLRSFPRWRPGLGVGGRRRRGESPGRDSWGTGRGLRGGSRGSTGR